MKDLLSCARDFALLMDQNRFSEASAFLAPDCVYEFREQKTIGREAIMKIYADNYASAAPKFDEVLFCSEVVAEDACLDFFRMPATESRPGVARHLFRIKYLDRVCKNGVWFEHRCDQVICFSGGLITAIRHIDLPGEAEKLTVFKQEQGILG